MNKYLYSAFAVSILFTSTDGHAMGRKKLNVAELKGVTESQVSKADGKATVMVRGKAAELVYRMMKEVKSEQLVSEALKMASAKGVKHMSVKGRQVSCSKMSNPKRKQDDYACSFEIKDDGTVWAGGEAFNPVAFNLARTETGSKIFKKAQARGLASVTPAPAATYSTGQVYLVYDEPGKQSKSENALIVFRGESAKELMGLLETNIENRAAKWGESKGKKGADIACVNATSKEPERCAMVVSFRDGSVTRSGNPLFR